MIRMQINKLVAVILTVALVMQTLPVAAIGSTATPTLNKMESAVQFVREDEPAVVVDIPSTFIIDDAMKETYIYVPISERLAPSEQAPAVAEGSIVRRVQLAESKLPSPEDSARFEKLDEIINSNERYSSLSVDERAFLEEYANVLPADMLELEKMGITMAESVFYAQLAAEYNFDVIDILRACATTEECKEMSAQLQYYTAYLVKDLIGTELDKKLRRFLLEGFSFSQAKNAYGISRTLALDIDTLLDKDDLRDLRKALSARDQSNYQLFADDLGVNVHALIAYAQENGLTFQEFERLIAAGRYHETELSEDPLPAPSMTPLSGGDTEYPDKYLIAPYRYDYNQNESVNLNTGSLEYKHVDYTLPGVNGLDLVIGRRYDSDSANIYNPVGGCYETYVPYYCVEYGVQGYYSTGERSYAHDQIIHQTYYSNSTMAHDAFNSIILPPSITYKDYFGPGIDLILGHYKSIYLVYLRDYTYYSTTENNSYLNSRYGLGQGWSFLFSSIENGKYLHLADGRTYEIQLTTTAGDSNLKDYTLSDLMLEQESGAYSNGSVSSAYTLYYKDGKREYFSSDGRLIGIKDRFNNTIKFVNDTLNGYPRITITDTLNRATTISGQSITGGHLMTVALPEGKTLKYTISSITSPVSGRILYKFEDAINTATHYNYTISSGGFDVYNKSTNAATNYFMNLTTVTHPTGAQSVYTYGQVDKNLGAYGLQRCYRLTSRADKIGSTTYNAKAYSYSNDNHTLAGIPQPRFPTRRFYLPNNSDHNGNGWKYDYNLQQQAPGHHQRNKAGQHKNPGYPLRIQQRQAPHKNNH